MLALIDRTQSQQAVDWFVQVALINRFLPDLRIGYFKKGDVRLLQFDIRPENSGRVFKMRIEYVFALKHGVQCLQPFLYCENLDIVRHLDNHIFASGGICYFFPADLSSKGAISCLYAVQCAIKWCDCYSYWEKNKQGGWPCREMPHGSYHPALFDIYRPTL